MRRWRLVLLGTVAAVAVATGLQAAGGLTTLYQLMFKQSGTSAVARTARSKVADFVSVMDFGATGNGVTNDTVAVTAAVAYAGDFVNAYFPCPGSYLTTTWGTIPCGYQELVAATGAVPRPVGTKIQEFLSAKDFGATGNGVTDDTAAIGNLLNAAASTQLINLPCPGTYVTSTYGTLGCGVYYPPPSGGTVRPVSRKLYETLSVLDYGAIGDGTTDDTSAVQAALNAGGHAVFFPAGTYKITSKLTVLANTMIRGEGANQSQIKKGYNGSLIDFSASYTGAEDIYLNGNSASFTGDVVLITGGTAQRFINVKFQCAGDAGNYCVEYSGALSGTNSVIDIGEFNGTSSAVAVKYPSVADGAAAPRTITNSKGGGMIIVDFAAANDPVFIGNFTNGLVFSSASVVNPVVMGSRIATNGGTTTITGGQGQFVANIFAGPVILDANASSTTFVGNTVPSNDVTDNGTGNVVLTQNFRLPSAGTMVINGVGPHAIGGATAANARLRLLGSFTGSTATYGVDNTDSLTVPSTKNGYGFLGEVTLIMAGSGTHDQFAQMLLAPPTISGSGATITKATTLQITGPPSGGVTNRSLWIQSGLFETAGDVLTTSTKNRGTCTLNAASPSVCTATVQSGTVCVATVQGTTAAAALHTVAVSVTTTTLTITGANGLSDVINYHCF